MWSLPSGNVKIAIENGHWNSGFSNKKWWFSIAMLVYQRVCGLYPLFVHRFPGKTHGFSGPSPPKRFRSGCSEGFKLRSPRWTLLETSICRWGSCHIYINDTYYYIYHRYDDYCRWLLSYLYINIYDTYCMSMIIILYIVLIVFICEISAVIHRSSVFQNLDLGCSRSGDGKPVLLWPWRND